MHLKKRRVFTFQNAVILASIIPVIFFGALTYVNSKKELSKKTFEYIENENKQKAKLIEEYFKDVAVNMRELSTTVSFLEKQTKSNISNIQEIQLSTLEKHYRNIEKDILALSKKDIFQYIFDFLRRGKTVESVYFENIKAYKDSLGFKNILLINEQGEILYATDREDLKNTNVRSLTSAFGTTFDKIEDKSSQEQRVYFVGHAYESKSKTYKHYALAHFQSVKGFIALEINQDELQKNIIEVLSLGTSAQSYLVFRENNETFLATDSKNPPGKLAQKVNNLQIQKGFEASGVDLKHSDEGEMELLGYTPFQYNDLLYTLQTSVNYKEVISPILKGVDYFQKFIQEYKYHDLFIVDTKGEVFYSVNKEKDIKQNLFETYGEQNFLVKAIKESIETKEFVLTDLELYSGCEDSLAQFALSPIININGEVQSVVVVQLMSDHVSALLNHNNTIYDSYDSYVVGEDKMLRSNTRFASDNFSFYSSLKEGIKIETKTVENAFHAKENNNVIRDYRDVDVYSSFSILEYPNFKWVLISEIDLSEVEQLLEGLKKNIFWFVVISSFVALIVMIVITNEKKKQDKKLNYTATHDNLTGLPNRKFALEFLSYMLANQKRLKSRGAVLFVDLDKFKIINDSYGHDTGDIVLVEVAKRLRALLREDDLVARLGGDEFIIVLNNFEHTKDIDKVCHKLISSVSQPIEDGKRSYEVGMSVGIAVFPQDGNSAEELLQFADTAMYRTKDTGRNGFTYYNKEMTEKSLQVSRVEDELKYAMVNKELELYYQPQIHLKDQRVIGVEALIRWNHPRDGLIMPNDFIPIAEESSLILDLGEWVIREACTSFLRWRSLGVHLDYIAVNMSPKQLQCPRCVENIQNIFREFDFNPEWLELEITENTLIENLENTLQNINYFKELGVKFSIDDFGTGYSSLSYLKSLRISTLKIDREFIKDILSDKDDRSIVNAIIAMGHTMNYTIVAEGAELKEEVVLLKHLACDIIQGYYYAKPLQEGDLIKYIENEEWID